MKELIAKIVQNTGSLPEICDVLIELTSNMRKEKGMRIGFISGIVSSDGLDKIPQNMAKLQEYTSFMSQRYSDAAFFSAADIFTEQLYGRLPEFKLPKPNMDFAFMEFWRRILKSGRITDVSFTPRWKRSIGARDEHKIATELLLPHQFVMQINQNFLLVSRCCGENFIN